ncbi:fasciclin domain-containing protein [Aspergillus lucknowensis]|uniref:FAS1 domain-containing protein n=1 Tax=Aspergillus lucknowensis TaxID=176173 RepID=A0ABR4LHA1_9EURO
MKLQQLLAVAAATVPACSTLAIQDVLHELEDLDRELFNSRNPLDGALESSPTFVTPVEVDGADIDKLSHINLKDVEAWIKSFIKQPLEEITNVPSDFVDIDIPLDTKPHHPHSDKTIYQLISESKYTTILAKIIKKDSELVDYLNSTEHKFTFFAPTDAAFEKIPHHHHKDHDHDHDGDDDDDDDDDHHHIPKEAVRALLRYHSSPKVLTAAQLFHSHTVPSALEDPLLGTANPDNGDDDDDEEQGLPQRIAVRAGFKGLTLNFYSHIVAADIGASNGLIHGIDSILLPPPPALLLLDVLPTHFSTFNLALYKTDLTSALNTTSESSAKGFTVFAPTNSAFARLGLKINAFLFSPPGLKYLRALLKYHVVPDRTLYSDVLYTDSGEIRPFGVKGFTHLDLPTLLHGHEIAVDVAHLGPYVRFKVNGWLRVGFADALAKDGVIHALRHILIPPKKLESGARTGWSGEDDELMVEDLIERLRPWVEEDEEGEEDVDAFWDGIVDRVEL